MRERVLREHTPDGQKRCHKKQGAVDESKVCVTQFGHSLWGTKTHSLWGTKTHSQTHHTVSVAQMRRGTEFRSGGGGAIPLCRDWIPHAAAPQRGSLHQVLCDAASLAVSEEGHPHFPNGLRFSRGLRCVGTLLVFSYEQSTHMYFLYGAQRAGWRPERPALTPISDSLATAARSTPRSYVPVTASDNTCHIMHVVCLSVSIEKRRPTEPRPTS